LHACALGHKPEPFASMGRANGGRGEQTPFRIEPEFGKITEDMGKSCPNNSWDVLQEHVLGFHVADDPCDFGPEPTVVVSAQLATGAAERLAGETGSDESHAATPCASVEGAQVRPDRSLIQLLRFHPGHESGRCVGVPLNVSHGTGDSSQGELHPGVAGAEMNGR
jgi:hypothetical protein